LAFPERALFFSPHSCPHANQDTDSAQPVGSAAPSATTCHSAASVAWGTHSGMFALCS